MSENKINTSALPKMALSEIPEPNSDAKVIKALVKESGRIVGYQLSDDTILSKEDGVNLAKQGGIKGVGIGVKFGNEYLKSIPDGNEDNNLGNLPSISNE